VFSKTMVSSYDLFGFFFQRFIYKVAQKNVAWRKLIHSCGVRARTSGKYKNHVGWSIQKQLER
jgi:hypothetical protein